MNIFNDNYTVMEYTGSCVRGTYFNPEGGKDGHGTFEEHNFPTDYLASINLDDIIDLTDYLFGDAVNCPTYVWDFGTDPFCEIAKDLLVGIDEGRYTVCTSSESLEGYLRGIVATLNPKVDKPKTHKYLIRDRDSREPLVIVESNDRLINELNAAIGETYESNMHLLKALINEIFRRAPSADIDEDFEELYW